MSLHYCVFVLFVPLVKCFTFGDSHIQTPLVEASENTFLKLVFPGGEEEYIRNWECHEGVWTEEMHLVRQPNCVCVKGVYAIGTDLCDEDFKIITGDNHCFDIRDKVIRKYLPLTGKRGFDGKANTVFRSDAPYFARLNSPTPTTSVPENMNFLFRMNDPTDFSIYSKLGNGQAARLKCVLGQTVPEDFRTNPIMQIVALPNCSNEFRGPKQWCDDFDFVLDYQWTLSVGQSWSKNGDVGTGDQYPSNCASGDKNDKKNAKVPAKKGKRQKRWAPKKGSKAKGNPSGKAKGKGKIDDKSAVQEDSKCDNFDLKLVEDEEYDTSADHFFQPDPTKPNPKFHSASFHQKEVNKQNRRVGHHIRKFYMDGDKRLENIPRFKEFPEYRYVQISKEILKTVCPAEYVPPLVIDFFIRAFRLLYIDSSPGYPYPIKSNEHEHTRIESALTKCKDEAQPIAFISNASCPDLGIHATNQSLNASLFAIYELDKNKTMPGDVAFNVSSMDIAVELIWKITLLTHYYCSEKFVINPFDFSLFFIKMEAMLKNPAIMFRWYYPGQFNRMLQFFLMHYNLEKFAKGVDRCVETVFAGSSYKHWMKRPAEMVGWNAKSKKLPHDVSKTFNSPTGNFGKGRKKRFYLQDDIWQKQGYCMHNTDAPYTEVRTYTFLSCKKKPIWFDNTD